MSELEFICEDCHSEFDSQRGLSSHISQSDSCSRWWDSKTQLKRLYITDGKSTIDLQKELGVSRETIRNRLHQYGIETRGNGKDHSEKEFANYDTLYQMHVVDKMTPEEIAQVFDCHFQTIIRWLKRFDIHTQHLHRNDDSVPFLSMVNGYEAVSDNAYQEKIAMLHRLIAVAEYGFEEVADNVVHHKNGVRWDNRPSNLELVSASEHTKLHHEHGWSRDLSDSNQAIFDTGQ